MHYHSHVVVLSLHKTPSCSSRTGNGADRLVTQLPYVSVLLDMNVSGATHCTLVSVDPSLSDRGISSRTERIHSTTMERIRQNVQGCRERATHPTYENPLTKAYRTVQWRRTKALWWSVVDRGHQLPSTAVTVVSNRLWRTARHLPSSRRAGERFVVGFQLPCVRRDLCLQPSPASPSWALFLFKQATHTHTHQHTPSS